MEIKCQNYGAIPILNIENVYCYCKFPVDETDIMNLIFFKTYNCNTYVNKY
jgi:hypothetical protein